MDQLPVHARLSLTPTTVTTTITKTTTTQITETAFPILPFPSAPGASASASAAASSSSSSSRTTSQRGDVTRSPWYPAHAQAAEIENENGNRLSRGNVNASTVSEGRLERAAGASKGQQQRRHWHPMHPSTKRASHDGSGSGSADSGGSASNLFAPVNATTTTTTTSSSSSALANPASPLETVKRQYRRRSAAQIIDSIGMQQDGAERARGQDGRIDYRQMFPLLNMPTPPFLQEIRFQLPNEVEAIFQEMPAHAVQLASSTAAKTPIRDDDDCTTAASKHKQRKRPWSASSSNSSNHSVNSSYTKRMHKMAREDGALALSGDEEEIEASDITGEQQHFVSPRGHSNSSRQKRHRRPPFISTFLNQASAPASTAPSTSTRFTAGRMPLSVQTPVSTPTTSRPSSSTHAAFPFSLDFLRPSSASEPTVANVNAPVSASSGKETEKKKKRHEKEKDGHRVHAHSLDDGGALMTPREETPPFGDVWRPPIRQTTTKASSPSSSSATSTASSPSSTSSISPEHRHQRITVDNDDVSIATSPTLAGRTAKKMTRTKEEEEAEEGGAYTTAIVPARVPALSDLPDLIRTFDVVPPAMQSYVLMHMLKRCSAATLQHVAHIVHPALRRDFVAGLPIEIVDLIFAHLDIRSICRAASVSWLWRKIIDGRSELWRKHMLAQSWEKEVAEVDLEFHVTKREILPCGGNGLDHPHRQQQPEHDVASAAAGQCSPPPDPSPTLAPFPFSVQEEALRRQQHRLQQQQQEQLPLLSQKQLVASFAHHPYKALCRRLYLTRANWFKGKSMRRTFAGHSSAVVTCLQFDADKLVSGSDDHTINVYDIQRGTLRSTLSGHEGGVWCLHFIGNTLATGATDRILRIWNMRTAQCAAIGVGHTSTIRCLQIVKLSKMPVATTAFHHHHLGQDTQQTEDQYIVVSGSRDATLRIWYLPMTAANSPHPCEPITQPGASLVCKHVLMGHTGSVRALATHGEIGVSASYDACLRVWDLRRGTCLWHLSGHSAKVYSIGFNGDIIASGSMDSTIRLWDPKTGTCSHVLEGHTSLVGLLQLSKDRLVSAAADTTIRSWDPRTGQPERSMHGHAAAITCFEFDNDKIVSGSEGSLKLWNVNTGKYVRDVVTGIAGAWRVSIDSRRCVAAVQKDESTWFEVLDFDADAVEKEAEAVARAAHPLVLMSDDDDSDETDGGERPTLPHHHRYHINNTNSNRSAAATATTTQAPQDESMQWQNTPRDMNDNTDSDNDAGTDNRTAV